MRSSGVAFGIKGIFPLIKKHAPECITQLPSLEALPRSTRLAIDATLLIQRLHFADDAHPSRHIIGFHRFIRHLRELSLVPIMVFDNFSQGARLPAKERENEKRRAKRNMLTVRARMEIMRGRRLEALMQAIKEWKDLAPKDRTKSIQLLQAWKEEDEKRGYKGRLSSSSDEALLAEDLDLLENDLTMQLEAIDSAGLKAPKEPVVASEIDQIDFLADALTREELSLPSPLVDVEVYPEESSSDVWSSILEAESSPVINIASKIHYLQRQYGSLLQTSSATEQADSEAGSAGPRETATQVQMTLAEGSVYSQIQEGTFDVGSDVGHLVGAYQSAQAEAESAAAASSLSVTADEEQAAQAGVVAIDKESSAKIDQEHVDRLAQLTAKNIDMQRTYLRSSTPLSSAIFEACATLCSLLKVPVLWTGDGSRTGGRRHEAEALAASLVRGDLADVVVSEDSDVLLYGAPLLRGVMGTRGLEWVDSSRVSTSLFPASEGTTEEQAKASSERQLLDFALLCGTDFNRTVPGIGSVTALKLIREYKSINGIRVESVRRRVAQRLEATKLAKEKGKEREPSKKQAKGDLFPMPDQLKWRDYSKELNEARKVFLNPPSPYWHATKLRASREDSEEIDYPALNEFLQAHNVSNRETSGWPRTGRSGKTQTSTTIPAGFGHSPFSDGSGAAASWTAQ